MADFPTTLPPKLATKWNLPDTLNDKYISATTSSIPGIRAKLAPFSDAAKEMGIPNTLIKIAKGAAQYFVTLESSAPAKDFVSNCNTFGDAVKVFSFAKGVDDILLNAEKKDATGIDLHQKNLGIASGFFQLIVSGMAGAKLLNTFQVISLAGISQALGTTTVLPFSVVTSGVEIVKNVIDITNKSLKMHKTNIQRDKIRTKHKNFKASADSATIGAFLQKHLDDMDEKQKAAEQKIINKPELKAAKGNVKKALTDYQTTLADLEALELPDVKKFPKLISSMTLTVTKWKQESALFEAKEAYDKEFGKYTKTCAKFAGRVQKFAAWENMKGHFDDKGVVKDANNNPIEADPLNQLVAEKNARWKAQRKNCVLDSWKDGIGITISVVATIGLIATIVLTFTGIGTIPVLLTMTSLWLLISIAGLGSALLAKYKKPVAIPTTNFKYYAEYVAA